jgi:outer membrane lipoprotein-sorting protein
VVALGAWLLAFVAPCGAALNSAQFDVVTQQQAQGANVTVTAKVWVKGDKARMESKHPMMGEQLVIVDGTSFYLLSPSQKAGQKRPVPTRNGKKVSVLEWITADVNALRSKAKKTGRQTIEGIACDVYVGSEKREGSSSSIKAWIATVQNTVFPMKVEIKQSVNRPGASLASSQTMMVKNLRTNVSIPDSRFAVPKDYKIATSAQPMPGIPRPGRP